MSGYDTDDTPLDFAADAAALAKAAPNAALKAIADLAQQAADYAAAIAEVSATLKVLEAKERMVLESLLPEAMDAANVKTFTTTDGLRIDVSPFLQVSLAGEKMATACAWLRTAGHDGLITRDVAVSFKKGQGTDADTAVALLREHGWAVFDKEAVNTASFKALLRELMENGTPVPLEQVGAYSARRAKITHVPQ